MSDIETPETETMAGMSVTYSHGQKVLFVLREKYFETVETLKNDGFNFCVDVTVVDFLKMPERTLESGETPQRFEVVCNLLSFSRKERVRVRIQIPAGDPSCDSIVDLYAGAENMEREAFDLLGIRFKNHPDLTRILMPEDWEGHPLRKDYEQGSVPVQFKAPARSR